MSLIVSLIILPDQADNPIGYNGLYRNQGEVTATAIRIVGNFTATLYEHITTEAGRPPLAKTIIILEIISLAVRTRQKYGHLPPDATLVDYEAIITRILFQPTADVHIYVWQQDAVYPTVVALHENEHWLVMFSLDGIMETAFPPTDPVTYLSDSRFRYIGTMQELLP